MTSPYTEILYKIKEITKDKIVYVHHPVDLRDQLSYTSKYYSFPRQIDRSKYSMVISNTLPLVHYEE